MKRALISLILGLTTAGGAVALTALPAEASSVLCSSISFDSSNGGDAEASGCSHSTAPRVRLWGDCELSPFTVYSPWRDGPFSNASFDTSSCTWGVNAAGFQH
jgi:hypothetical protein